MISWKSILTSLSDHLTRRAAQTYRWNSEKPCSSAFFACVSYMVKFGCQREGEESNKGEKKRKGRTR